MVWQDGENAGRSLHAMKWGLVPVWAKSATPTPCPVNARAETIHEKNTFRRLVDSRRCVVLADGYFEWKREGVSQGPYFFTPHSSTFSSTETDHQNGVKVEMKHENGDLNSLEKGTRFSGSDHPMLRMAGLYDVWHNPETGEKLYSYTVLTVFASKLTSTIHDRMPALLWTEEAVDSWLNPSIPYSAVKYLLEPSETLTIWPVSSVVGNVKNDTPACIQPISRETTEKKLITSFFKPKASSSAVKVEVKKEDPSSSASSSSASAHSSQESTALPSSWATEDLNESLIDESGNPITSAPLAVKLEPEEGRKQSPVKRTSVNRTEPVDADEEEPKEKRVKAN